MKRTTEDMSFAVSIGIPEGSVIVEATVSTPDRKMTNASIRLLPCVLKSQPEKKDQVKGVELT